MEEKIILRLQELIEEVKEVEDYYDFDDWREVALNALENMFPQNKNVLISIEDIIAFDGLDDEGEDVTEDAVSSAIKILNGLIKDVKLGFGITKPSLKKPKPTSPVHVINHVNQSNHQSVEIDIEQRVKQQVDLKLKFIVDTFKHELNGRQMQELKEIQESTDTPDIKKQRFFDKVKSFGLDVTAGLISGILANPDFIQQLTH